MDGNESLKRVRRARKILDDIGNTVEMVNIEREDPRWRQHPIYLEASEVNRFSGEVKARKTKVNYRESRKTTLTVCIDQFLKAVCAASP